MMYDYGERRVVMLGECFIAPSADVIGSVQLGNECSVWFGAVLRGDNDWIHLGDGSNIQDGSIVHVDPGVPVVIGRNVTVGHGAMIHGCQIADGCLIGNRAIILDGARIGENSLIAAGALITPDTQIPPGSVVMGAPGKVVRAVQPRDLERMMKGCEAYRVKSRTYAALLRQRSTSA
jgi:carbonic anhydrase/acetyltransferase-like protein (isoleucine patch superfamily)